MTTVRQYPYKPLTLSWILDMVLLVCLAVICCFVVHTIKKWFKKRQKIKELGSTQDDIVDKEKDARIKNERVDELHKQFDKTVIPMTSSFKTSDPDLVKDTKRYTRSTPNYDRFT